MNKLLLFLFFALASHCAQSSPRKVPLEVNAIQHAVDIGSGKARRRYYLSHSVEGYATNCDSKWTTVWGSPKNLSSADPQAGAFTIINTKSHKIKTIRTGKGIMNVEFLAKKDYAHVLLGNSLVINLVTGRLKYIDANEEDKLQLEDCDLN